MADLAAIRQYNIRRIGDSKWKTIYAADLYDVIKNKTELFEIKMFCAHFRSEIQDGNRVCKECGEVLEVLSYRD